MNSKESKLTVWEVLEKYADIRDELDNALSSFEMLKNEIEMTLEDISDELDQLTMDLSECDRVFKRFRAVRPASYFYADGHTDQELPLSSALPAHGGTSHESL